MIKALCIFAVLSCILIANATELSLQDRDSIKISLLPDSEGPVVVSDKDKAILRYGFHRTQDCKVFEKAFVCVRKCLDLNYQIAQSDKNCICTCYKNNILAQYKSLSAGVTKWKLGAPTTSLPPWAGGDPAMSKPNDYEINANFTEFVGDTDIQVLPSNDESGAVNNNHTDSTVQEPTSGVTAAEGATEVIDKEAGEAKAGDQPSAPGEDVTPAEIKAPAVVPANSPTKASADAPVEAPAKAPADAPAEAPTDAPVEAPADAPTEAPAEAAPAEK